MLGTLAYGDFDGWWRSVGVGIFVLSLLVSFHNCLDGVAQQLANDVFQVAKDVREAGLQMSLDFDLGYDYFGSVGTLSNLLYCFSAALDNFLGDTLEEDLTNELGFGELGTGGEPRCVEGVC